MPSEGQQLDLRLPRPAWAGRPVVFASGSNDPGEIRGFADAGIAPGVTATRVRAESEDELVALAGSGIRVFLDSGAFSEVSASPKKQKAAGLDPQPGTLLVVDPIADSEWEERLALYLRLARALGEQLYAVAPDRVGSQDETLARLRRWADEVRAVHEAGAHILLPLQRGERTLAMFYRQASTVLAFSPDPAFPMKKAGTPLDAIGRTLRALAPPSAHFLGLGIKNRRTGDVLRRVREVAPMTRVSMDSNLITSAVGRRPLRPLTQAQDSVRAEGIYGVSGVAEADGWSIVEDYTEAIAEPSSWLGPTRLENLADAAGLSPAEARSFIDDPDGFLQGPLHTDDPHGPRRWEDPAIMAALDRAWCAHVERQFTAPRKAEAIRRAFADHPAARPVPGAEASRRTG